MSNQQTIPQIKIDNSRKYNVNAGQCDKCGFYKTWEYRFKNPKTGKMMPGHVTEEGFKINDGSCPYWSSRSKKQSNGNQFQSAQSFFNQPVQNEPSFPQGGARAGPKFSLSKQNGVVSLQMSGQAPVTLSREDVIQMLYQLSKCIAQ
ncbi:MAG: hypothetical protein ACTSU9_14030 [Promethearchaeota archaeon]